MSEITEFKKLISQILDAYPDVVQQMFQSEVQQESNYRYADDEEEFINTVDGHKIKFKLEDNYGGEGQGEQYWSVYSFEKDGKKVYVRFNGWYASYVGSEFVDWAFVEPKQKTITVYE